MFRGAFTALVTPFREGRVDDDALQRLVTHQIEGGIDGLVPCGTTGESPTLSTAEHLHVVEIVVRAAAGRVPVLAGAGSNCTREAVALVAGCKALGADGTLQITPYYNRPSQAQLKAHYAALAELGLPIVLYNVPSRTGTDLLAETVAELAENDAIVGIKEATGDMTRAARIRELCPPNFQILSGDDFSLLPFLALGGDGVISVGSNPAPALFARLCAAAREGHWDEARELHYRQLPLSRALFSAPSPGPAKAAMALLGLIESDLRLPLLPLPADCPEHAALELALRNLEIIK